MPLQIEFEFIKEAEYSFLEEMLYEAIFVPKGYPKFPKSIIDHPDIKKYINSWNQSTFDIAIIAKDCDNLVGAVWGRLFPEHNKGYGFVDQHTPEISMAIIESYRNKGIGSAFLKRIESAYHKRGIKQLSLSVSKLNPATRLYERFGFEVFHETETAFTMIKKINTL